jgi:hypothetical protein
LISGAKTAHRDLSGQFKELRIIKRENYTVGYKS